MTSNQLLYMFSTTARPLYIQDPLNVLAVPQGFRYHLRYDVDRVSPTLLSMPLAELKGLLEGRDLLMLFVDQHGRKNERGEFYPLRLGTVRRIDKQAGIVHVYFTVGPYVSWPDVEDRAGALEIVKGFTSDIVSLLNDEGPPTFLLPSPKALPGSLQRTSGDAVSEERDWQEIVSALSYTDTFSTTVFYRQIALEEMRNASNRKALAIEEQVIPGQCGYRLSSGAIYSLKLSFYRPDVREPVLRSKIQCVLDRTYFAYVPADILIDFRYDLRDLDIIPTRTDRATYTRLTLQLKEDDQQTSPSPVRSPRISFVLRLGPSWGWYAQIFFLFVLQLVVLLSAHLTTLHDLFGWLSTYTDIELQQLSLLVSGAAALASTVLLFFLVRKLPNM